MKFRHKKTVFICIALCLNFFILHRVRFSNEKQTYSSLNYTLFYGEWEVTEDIYVDPMPIRDIIYQQNELEQIQRDIYKSNKIEKILFLPDEIIVNNTKKIDNIIYVTKIFPANDGYNIHFTLTLRDIGLTEDRAPYYAYVEFKTDEAGLEYTRFFLKDENTIIMYYGSYCITYKRNTEDIELRTPDIISG